ncbi:unnamed protein product [Effrenium voratum]|nr:unnamed protein product [Effrenium voratum]
MTDASWHGVCSVRVAPCCFMLCRILRALFMCPSARYVDDFFGVSRASVQWNAGRILTVISSVLGFPVDDDKSAESDIRLIVLGAVWEIGPAVNCAPALRIVQGGQV